MSRGRSAALPGLAPGGGGGGGALGKLTKPRRLIPEWVWTVVDGFLAFVLGGALAATFLGDWIGWGADTLAGLLGGIINWLGGSVSTPQLLSVVVGAMLFILILDVLDMVADTPAIVCMILMPSIGLHATGPVREAALWLMEGAQQLGWMTLGNLLGG